MMDFNSSVAATGQLIDRLGNMHSQLKSNSSDNPFLDVLLEEDLDEELIKYDSQAAGTAGLLLMDPAAMFHGSSSLGGTSTRLGAISCASSSISPAGSIFDDEADDDSLLFTSENDLPTDMLLTVNPVTSPLNSTNSIITSFNKALDFPSSVTSSNTSTSTSTHDSSCHTILTNNSQPHQHHSSRPPSHFRFSRSSTLTPDGRRLEPTLAELNSGMQSFNGLSSRRHHNGSSLPWDTMDCDSDEILAKIGSSTSSINNHISNNNSTSTPRIIVPANGKFSMEALNAFSIKKEKLFPTNGPPGHPAGPSVHHSDHQYGAKNSEQNHKNSSLPIQNPDVLKNPYLTYVPFISNNNNNNNNNGNIQQGSSSSTYQITVTTNAINSSASSGEHSNLEDVKPLLLANGHLVGFNTNNIKAPNTNSSKISNNPNQQRFVIDGGNSSASSSGPSSSTGATTLSSILMAEPLLPPATNVLSIKSEPISVELNPVNSNNTNNINFNHSQTTIVRPTGGKICPSGTMIATSANHSNALTLNHTHNHNNGNAAAMAGQIILTVSGTLPSMLRPADPHPSTSKASTSTTQSGASANNNSNKPRTARKRNNSMSTECSLTSSHDEGFASNADESYSDQEDAASSVSCSTGQKPAKKVKRSPSAAAAAASCLSLVSAVGNSSDPTASVSPKKKAPSAPSTTGDDSCSEDDGDDDDDESFYGDYQPSDLLGATTSDDADNRWSLDMGRSRKSGQKRYFWQYNVQSKGPKGTRLSNSPSGSCRSGIEGPNQTPTTTADLDSAEDPHVLQEASDPVFAPDCAVEGVKHSGKARRGDGNDLTPNPRKLLMIGLELKKLSKVINGLTPVAEVPVTARNKTRKEKNKLASRACRLKKKAQHEANKIKLLGLQKEHAKLIETINLTRQVINGSLSVGVTRGLSSRVEELVGERDKTTLAVASHSADFVNSVLDKVAAGQNNGGLDTI